MIGGGLAPARWRLALRFARREVQRRPGRTVLVALLIAVPMAVSGVMLLRAGIETRGHGLEEIQDALSRT